MPAENQWVGKVNAYLRESIKNERCFFSMDLCGITPKYVYRMWWQG